MQRKDCCRKNWSANGVTSSFSRWPHLIFTMDSGREFSGLNFSSISHQPRPPKTLKPGKIFNGTLVRKIDLEYYRTWIHFDTKQRSFVIETLVLEKWICVSWYIMFFYSLVNANGIGPCTLLFEWLCYILSTVT